MRRLYNSTCYRPDFRHRGVDIPVAFEAAWVLAALVPPNQIVSLCSGASLACRLHASSIPLGIIPSPALGKEGASLGTAQCAGACRVVWGLEASAAKRLYTNTLCLQYSPFKPPFKWFCHVYQRICLGAWVLELGCARRESRL